MNELVRRTRASTGEACQVAFAPGVRKFAYDSPLVKIIFHLFFVVVVANKKFIGTIEFKRFQTVLVGDLWQEVLTFLVLRVWQLDLSSKEVELVQLKEQKKLHLK